MADKVPAQEALTRLREGNERFAAIKHSSDKDPTRARRQELAGGQHPFAIILSCADSRVPSELIFDQGLGDLFVIRVAGNIVAPSLVGSVEYAAAVLGTQLVAVVGHSSCGAVKAAVDHVLSGEAVPSSNIADIVNRVRPAVDTVVDVTGRDRPMDELMHQCVRANVRLSVAQLRNGSPVLEGLRQDGKLMVVGAEYDLSTGVADFFDVPASV
jgi:carbonic anhydrase